MVTESATEGLSGTVRFEWSALDAWFEEDEEVFGHPRNPYARGDALRSKRRVRMELDGAVLANTRSPVMVFETGLPTRYYRQPDRCPLRAPRREQHGDRLPVQGPTGGYWSVVGDSTMHQDLAWAYDLATREVLPIAGMVAFYNERVDAFLDGQLLERPRSAFLPGSLTGSAVSQLRHQGIGLLDGQISGQAGHRQHPAAALHEDHLIGQARPQVRMPLGDRDLLAQPSLLLGGHGRDDALVVGALHAAADRPADELRGRAQDDARELVFYRGAVTRGPGGRSGTGTPLPGVSRRRTRPLPRFRWRCRRIARR